MKQPDQPHEPQPLIVIAPWTAIEPPTHDSKTGEPSERGREQFDRDIENSVDRHAVSEVNRLFSLGLPVPALVQQFLDTHLSELRELHQRGTRFRGAQGAVYLLARLDEPPDPRAPEPDTTQRSTTIGGYKAVYIGANQLHGDRFAQAAARKYGSVSRMVLICRTAHAARPHTTDQLYVLVIPADYTPPHPTSSFQNRTH